MLKEGKTIQMPTYSYLTCTRQEETVEVKPSDVVIVEGILVLTDPTIRSMLDIKVLLMPTRTTVLSVLSPATA